MSSDPPALPRGQHGDADNSFAPNWSPSGLPSYTRRRRQPCDDDRRDRGAHRGLRRGRRARPGERVRRGRDLRTRTTPWSTSSGRRGRTGGPTSGAARSRTGCASRREILRRIRERCGDDFIIGLAVSADPVAEAVPSHRRAGRDRRLARRATADGLRHVRDGLVLPFRGDHPDVALSSQRLGEPFAAGAQGRRPQRASSRPRATSGRPAAAEAVIAAGQADMVSIVRGQIADPHLVAKARAGPRGRGPAVHLVQPAVLGPALARLLDLVPGQPVRRARMGVGGDRFEPADVPASVPGRRRRAGRARGGAGRGGARPPGDARRSAAGARRPVPAGRAASRRAARSRT